MPTTTIPATTIPATTIPATTIPTTTKESCDCPTKENITTTTKESCGCPTKENITTNGNVLTTTKNIGRFTHDKEIDHIILRQHARRQRRDRVQFGNVITDIGANKDSKYDKELEMLGLGELQPYDSSSHQCPVTFTLKNMKPFKY